MEERLPLGAEGVRWCWRLQKNVIPPHHLLLVQDQVRFFNRVIGHSRRKLKVVEMELRVPRFLRGRAVTIRQHVLVSCRVENARLARLREQSLH
jgi:hypothetical protein